MATYKDFQDAMIKNGMSPANFSGADIALAKKNPYAGIQILNAKLDYGRATTDAERQAAHQSAESARSLGGYSGGEDGSANIVQSSAAGKPTYSNPYADRYEKAVGELANSAPFKYDAQQDPLWAQYQQIYQREGQRAMENALAQAAARTGGLASSYAETAAAQANDYYMQQAADRLPELERYAYDKYQQERQNKLNALNVLRQAQEDDYARYLDLLDQYNKEQDRKAEEEKLAWEKEYKENQLKWDEYQNALKQAELGAQFCDYSGLEELGITPNTDNIITAALASEGKSSLISDADVINALKGRYGDNRVIDWADWTYLLSQGVTEAQLRRLGYSYR